MFGIPGMLWWVGAISVPILIHLFARQRYKRVPWAAMEFLLRAYKKTRKRIRLEHLLLLLLRILAILLFVLALADPRLEPGKLLGGGDNAPRDVVILLDQSFSMGVKDPSGSTPFAWARQQALRLTRSLRRDRSDTISLITVGRPARAVLIGNDDIESAQQEIERLELGDGGTDYVGALRTALGVLQDLTPGAELYLFTDSQKTGFMPPSPLSAGEGEGVGADQPQEVLQSLLSQIAARQTGITFVVPDAPSPSNVAITDLRSRTKVLATGISSRFEVTLTNFGDRPQGGEIHLHVDGGSKPVEIQTLDLITPGRPEGVSFRHTFRLPGSHYVEARFLSDGLDVDNRRGLAVQIRDRVRVVIVDGDPGPEPSAAESFYLSRALDPGADPARPSLFAPEVIDETRLDLLDLRGVDLLVLMNVRLISPRRADEIQAFVEQGGGLLVFLGDKTDPASLNSLLYKGGSGVLPARVAESRGADRASRVAFELQIPDFQHPALRYFEDPLIRPYLTMVPFYRFFDVEVPEDDPATRVLARFDQRRAAVTAPAPAIIEKVTGAGRTLLITTSGDDEWNDLPIFPTYLMLTREIAKHLVEREAGLENLQVPGDYRRVLKSFAREVVVSRDGEQLQVIRPLALEGDQGYEIELDALDVAGVYRLDISGQAADAAKDPSPVYVAVNVDPTESDLTRLGADTLRASFPGVDLRVLGELEGDDDEARGGRERRLWWWFLAAAFAMLLLDTALSQIFGLRSRGGA